MGQDSSRLWMPNIVSPREERGLRADCIQAVVVQVQLALSDRQRLRLQPRAKRLFILGKHFLSSKATILFIRAKLRDVPKQGGDPSKIEYNR